jgi:hypothetical protein
MNGPGESSGTLRKSSGLCRGTYIPLHRPRGGGRATERLRSDADATDRSPSGTSRWDRDFRAARMLRRIGNERTPGTHDAVGITAHSRRLSGSDTAGDRPPCTKRPRRGSQQRHNWRRLNEILGFLGTTTLRSLRDRVSLSPHSGGVAALDHRLCAANPTGFVQRPAIPLGATSRMGGMHAVRPVGSRSTCRSISSSVIIPLARGQWGR